MCKMNVLEAKTNFSKIISMLENHEEDEVIVARAGKPVVRITYRPSDAAKILFDYEIFDPQSGEIYLKAHSTQVFMDSSYNLLWNSPAFYESWKKEMGLL